MSNIQYLSHSKAEKLHIDEIQRIKSKSEKGAGAIVLQGPAKPVRCIHPDKDVFRERKAGTKKS